MAGECMCMTRKYHEKSGRIIWLSVRRGLPQIRKIGKLNTDGASLRSYDKTSYLRYWRRSLDVETKCITSGLRSHAVAAMRGRFCPAYYEWVVFVNLQKYNPTHACQE